MIRPNERRKRFAEVRRALPFLAPWLIGFLGFTALPIALSAYFSLCYYDGGHVRVFIGLRNYRELLWEDPVFATSLRNTLYMLLIGMPLSLGFCLLVAMGMVWLGRRWSWLKAVVYAPSMMPVVAVSILWIWLLNTQYGIVNQLLQVFGLKPIAWLTDPRWTKPALILMGLWSAGPTILIYYAALLQVPSTLYEAATIDGANAWQRFLHITLPAISPTLYFTVVTGTIGYFQYFSQAYVMTNGGPQDATLFYALHMFNEAFLNWRMGYASAMAWLLFAITLGCLVVLHKISKKWVHYA